MRILLASSEIHPYSKTGGLADMVGALGKALARRGHQVGLVTPLYAGIRERFPKIQPLDAKVDLLLGARLIQGSVYGLRLSERVDVFFVDQHDFYSRPSLYQEGNTDYPDNAARFVYLSKAVVELARRLPWHPEVVHCHDWQLGVVPLLVQHQNQTAGWGDGHAPPGLCMTIHNLAYQGVFPKGQYELTNLPWGYFSLNGVEFYGQFSCLKAGIVFADVLTTVSPRYAREIMTEEFGCGLDGLLRQRHGVLAGILNGVDYDEWNTSRNPFLKYSYSADNFSGKTGNKLELQKELGLPVDASIPLFGSISRLVEQKGVDIQLAALEEMLRANIQFCLLGSGSPAFELAYRDLAQRFPSKVAIRLGYDQGLSHRIEAGCDFYLMPSRYEPCGLNQMYSLRYGTIPIVRATGGLDDTVIDIREDVDQANGIQFDEYSGPALAKAIRKALALYREPELRLHYQQNGMHADFSWDRTAQQYEQVYERALGGPTRRRPGN